MYEIYYTNEFKNQLKLMIKRGENASVMNTAIEILGNTGTLPVIIEHINYQAILSITGRHI